jgi:hypothetical protein
MLYVAVDRTIVQRLGTNSWASTPRQLGTITVASSHSPPPNPWTALAPQSNHRSHAINPILTSVTTGIPTASPYVHIPHSYTHATRNESVPISWPVCVCACMCVCMRVCERVCVPCRCAMQRAHMLVMPVLMLEKCTARVGSYRYYVPTPHHHGRRQRQIRRSRNCHRLRTV